MLTKISQEICADRIEPKLIPVRLLCLLSSSICFADGLYKTHARALVPAFMAYDTCSGYKVIAPSALPPDYRDYVIQNAPLPQLTGASGESLQLSGSAKHFGAARPHALPTIVRHRKAFDSTPNFEHQNYRGTRPRPSTSSLETQVSKRGKSLCCLDDAKHNTGRTTITENRTFRSGASSMLLDGVGVSSLRLTKLFRIPALTQMSVRPRRTARSLSYLEQRLPIATPLAARITNRIAKLDSRKTLAVIVANFTTVDRMLLKSTRVEKHRSTIRQTKPSCNYYYFLVRSVKGTNGFFMYRLALLKAFQPRSQTRFSETMVHRIHSRRQPGKTKQI